MPTHGPRFFSASHSHLNSEIKTAIISLCDYVPPGQEDDFTPLRESLALDCEENPLAQEYIDLVGDEAIESFLTSNQRCKSLIDHLHKYALYSIRDTFEKTGIEWKTGNLMSTIADGISEMVDKRQLASENTVEAMDKGQTAMALAEEQYQAIQYQYCRVCYWNKLLVEMILPLVDKVANAMGQPASLDFFMQVQPPTAYQPQPM